LLQRCGEISNYCQNLKYGLDKYIYEKLEDDEKNARIYIADPYFVSSEFQEIHRQALFNILTYLKRQIRKQN
jgi:hypothetical protein